MLRPRPSTTPPPKFGMDTCPGGYMVDWCQCSNIIVSLEEHLTKNIHVVDVYEHKETKSRRYKMPAEPVAKKPFFIARQHFVNQAVFDTRFMINALSNSKCISIS